MANPSVRSGLVSAVIADPGRGILMAEGTTLPSDATAGYAPGCIFVKKNGAADANLYKNQGTKASCSFKALVGDGATVAALTVTALTLDSTLLLATGLEVNRAADMSTRVVAIAPGGSATLSITEAAHDGKTIYLTKTDGWNATLPVPVAGMKFRIVIGATITVASTIKSVAGTHLMFGHARLGNNSDNTTVDWQALAASTYDTIDLLGTANSTGGVEGQVITIEAMSSTRWLVEIAGDAAGTEVTPFADTVA